MSKSIGDVISKVERLVGFRGTVEEIKETITMLAGHEATLTPAEEDVSLDLCYVSSAGMVGEHYADFDIFVLETRQKDIYHVTEVTFIG